MFEQLSIELLEARGDLGDAHAFDLASTAALDDEEGTRADSVLLVLAGLAIEARQEILDDLADHGLVVKLADVLASSASDQAGQLLSQVDGKLRRVLHRKSIPAAAYLVQSEPSAEAETVLKFPLLTIALDSREVFVRGRQVQLSRTEFNLLRLMASSPGRVFSREDLVLRSRGSDYPVTSRSIDVQIVGIRKKLGHARLYIETVRGAGYRFAVPDDPGS